MNLQIDSRIHVTEFSTQEANDIRQRYSFPNPNFTKAIRLGKSTWNIPREICLCRAAGDGILSLPRGLAGEFISIYKPGTVVDGSVTRPIDFCALQTELRDYQLSAVLAMFSKRQGVLVAGCGSGKTIMALAIILLCLQRTLILCHTLDLVRQWQSRIKTFLGLPVGIIGGGSFQEGTHITIATIQSLNKPLDKEFTDGYGLLIQDETHHTPAWSFRKVIERFPAQRRYGLSATPTRADGFSFLLHAVVGKVLHQIHDADLEQSGNLVVPSVKVVESVSTDFSECEDYGQMLEAIVTDDLRNELILKHVAIEAGKGYSCLVLSERIAHNQRLHELFQRSGISSATISGEDSKHVRRDVLEAVSTGKTLVLFASKIADEGLDLPRLSRLFLACPTRSTNNVTQRIGRIKRPFPGKPDPIVYDFLDSNSTLAVSQFRSRKYLVYKDLQIEEIRSEINGYNLYS